MARTCPDCSLTLERKDFHGTTIDACPRCAGIYFDEGELNDIHSKSATAFDELDDAIQAEPFADAFTKEHTRLCPGCATAMSPYRYMYSSPIVLESCRKCGGIWVQNGELKAIAEYSRLDHSRPGTSGVVTQMENTTHENVARAKIAQRQMRLLSQRMRPR